MAVALRNAQDAQAFEGFYDEPNPNDPSRRMGQMVYNNMSQGEIYAPDPMTGAGGDFISPGQDMYGRQDEQQLLQGSGYYDAMAQQTPQDQGVQRLNRIQELTGATVDNRNPLYRQQEQLDQDKITAYNAMSDADKLGLAMVESGTMTAKEWYAIKKKEEKDLRDAMIEMAKENAPNTSLSKDGAPLPMSASAVEGFANPRGGVSAEISPKETISRQYINSESNKNITGGGSRPRIGGTSGATDEDNDKAWEKYITQATTYTGMMGGISNEGKIIGEDLKQSIVNRDRSMRLAVQLRSVAQEGQSDLEVPIADAIANSAVSSKNTMFASSPEPIVADTVGSQITPKLNLDGIIKAPSGESIPVYKYLLKTNPQTGQLYTPDQIFDKIIESKRGIFNDTLKGPLTGLFTPKR